MRITPSNIGIWGGDRDEGARYTRQQIDKMARLGIKPDAPFLLVKMNDGTKVRCPILDRRPGGRAIEVISTGGYPEWVKP